MHCQHGEARQLRSDHCRIACANVWHTRANLDRDAEDEGLSIHVLNQVQDIPYLSTLPVMVANVAWFINQAHFGEARYAAFNELYADWKSAEPRLLAPVSEPPVLPAEPAAVTIGAPSAASAGSSPSVLPVPLARQRTTERMLQIQMKPPTFSTAMTRVIGEQRACRRNLCVIESAQRKTRSKRTRRLQFVPCMGKQVRAVDAALAGDATVRMVLKSCVRF